MILGKSLAKPLGVSLGKSFAGDEGGSYVVTFSCTHGSVGATVDGVGIQSGSSVEEGKTVVFTITPDQGYDYTGTNPESVVVSGDITKSYVCTFVTSLVFTSTGDSAIIFNQNGTWSGTWPIETSLNGSTWSSYTLGTTIYLSDGQSVYFRGQKDSTAQAWNVYRGFITGGSLAASGDVTSLLNGTGGVLDLTPYGNNTFRSLFYNCTVLTSAPSLPSTTLIEGCYALMFGNCTALTSAPALPAQTLASSCYSEMFNYCTSLQTPPSLPAQTLVQSCYQQMFSSCTSLSSAPTLSSTSLASQCYSFMFYGCTSLTQAPSLPATTLVYSCYQSMFEGCTKLEGPVNISATSPYYEGTSSACIGMFTNSGTQRVGTNKSIIIGEGGTVSDWNSSTAGIDSTYWTVQAPVQPNYLKFTSSGTSRVRLSSGHYVYDGNSWISDANGVDKDVNCEYSLDDGTTWTTWPTSGDIYFTTMLVRGNNPSGWGAQSSTKYFVFMDSSVSISGDITSLLNGVGGVTDLTSYGSSTFEEVFMDYNQIGYLVDASDLVLPSTTLTERCYLGLFARCANLVSVPSFPASTLLKDCYRFMFGECSRLAGPINISATSPYYSGTSTACDNMFYLAGRVTGAGGTIYVGGGTVSEWQSAASIDSSHWTVQAPVTWTGLKFTSDSTNTVCISTGVWLSEELHSETPANVTHNCEYSADGINWTTIPEEGSTAAPTFSGTVYVRGNNPEGWDNDSTIARITFGGSGHVTLSGNILSLIDNGTGTATTVPSGTCFTSLFGTGYPGSGKTVFSNNNAIVDASGLVLNNGDVSQVYPAMFRGCTYLVNPPALPATTLGRYSYQYMFADCSHLVSAPVLPALTLTQSCYGAMFQNCTSLTGPVNISATSPYYSGTSSACIGMFTNSGSAGGGTIYVGGNVSDWNSTNCGINSTYWTVQAPWTGLKFTSDSTNTVYLYEGTWLCEDDSVASNPNISHNCQYSLDNGTTWNTMPTDSGSAVSFTTMQVRGNNSSGWGDGSNAPSFRFNGDGHVSLSGNLFSLLDNGTGTITSIPSGSRFPATFGNVLSWSLEYTKVTDASGLIIPDASATNSYALFFQGCSDLVTPPSVLPSTITNGSFNQMFRNCTSLTSAPSLPATTLAPNCYQFMFQGCTSLVTPPSLPAPTLKSYCYTSMFNSCTKLTGPVNISATSPYSSGTTSACSNMFANSGTASGAGGTIYVGGGTVSEWQSSASIDTNYWTVEVPTEEDE